MIAHRDLGTNFKTSLEITKCKIHQLLTSIFILKNKTLTHFPGDRMHHAGPRAGTSAHLPEGSASAHAGLLAERTPAEAGHQRHLQPPRNPRKEPARLSGHPGVTACRDELGKTHFCWQAWKRTNVWEGLLKTASYVQMCRMNVSSVC